MTFARRRVLQAFVLTTTSSLGFGVTAQIPIATAINRAGRFRALAQRSAKAYAQQVLEVTPGASASILTTAQQLMAQGFDDLAKAGLAGDAASQLQTLRQDTSALTAALAGTPSRANLPKVNAASDKLTATAERLVTAIEASARQASSRIVNTAGRQRMLSQRMAKNYFLQAAGLDAKPLRDEIAADRAEFKKALTGLEAAPVSTLAIRNDLQQIQAQWTFFEAGINRQPDAETLRTVATSSERVLELANNLTVLYEAALKDVLGTT